MFVSAHPDALPLIFLLSLAATVGMLILPLCTTGASYVHCCARSVGFITAETCLESCTDKLVDLHCDKPKCTL